MIRVDEREMRSILLNRLSSYKDCFLYEEFTVPSGRARADIVAVNGHVSAYEIKSDFDSLKRLETQIPEYDLIFEMNYIVTGQKFIDECLNIVPEYWGVILIKKNEKGKIFINFLRRAKINPNITFENFIGLLTSEQVKQIALNQPKILKKHSKKHVRKLFKQDVIKILNNDLSLSSKKEITDIIRNSLKSTPKSIVISK